MNRKNKFLLSALSGPAVTAAALVASDFQNTPQISYEPTHLTTAEAQVPQVLEKATVTAVVPQASVQGLEDFVLTTWNSLKPALQKVGDYLTVAQSSYSTSQAGVDFIIGFEDLRLSVYHDERGLDTICYGHLIKPGETFTTQTEESCKELMRQDLSESEDTVRNSVKVDLTQDQYNALVSLAYNIGQGAFRESTLVKKLNSKNYTGAAEQFGVWNKVTKNGIKKVSRGLTTRRAAERNIFENGVYDSTH